MQRIGSSIPNTVVVLSCPECLCSYNTVYLIYAMILLDAQSVAAPGAQRAGDEQRRSHLEALESAGRSECAHRQRAQRLRVERPIRQHVRYFPPLLLFSVLLYKSTHCTLTGPTSTARVCAYLMQVSVVCAEGSWWPRRAATTRCACGTARRPNACTRSTDTGCPSGTSTGTGPATSWPPPQWTAA